MATPNMTIQQAFDLAAQHHQAGRLPQAEHIYRQILIQQPQHAGSLHLLGVIAYQAGQLDSALSLIRQAIASNPNYADAYSNLGNVLMSQGRLDESIAASRQAIALDPNCTEAYSNLGNALTSRGRFDESISACRQAIALNPNHPGACNNLGNALAGKRLLLEAIAAFRQAISLNPNYSEAYSNLGSALKDQGNFAEAAAACRQAITLNPNFFGAYINLGNALAGDGHMAEAIAAFRQAITLNPNCSDAYNNLGAVLKFQGQLDESIAACRQAIALNPNYPDAFTNLGNALKAMGRLDEAIAAYRQAVALNPLFSDAHSNLVYTLYFHPDYDTQAIRREHQHWNQQHAEPLKKLIQPPLNGRSPGRRLKIGYVSPDFRDHVVGRNLLPLLAQHDAANVEVFCYAQVAHPDALTDRFRTSAHHWRSLVGLSDDQAAQLIRQDQIDILVDLALHLANNRLLLFARKPAPVQVTFAGYPGTTGLNTMDYRLSDSYLDPSGMDESIYSEETVRLPDSFWCYDPLECHDVPVNALPASTNSFITLGCLNNFCKVNDAVLRLWAKVLHAVPNSHLLLLIPEGSTRQQTLGQMEKEGIAPQRIEFVSHRPLKQYLELYHRIDIGLDTFPYNGHTTSLDSFWMGVPVITRVGETVVSRAGLCQLMNLGLPELIAYTPEQYVQIAADLARDLPRLAHLRSTLRPRMQHSPLMDAPRFARNIETAYRQMWRKYCLSNPPKTGV